jgi:hypothetical protein
MIATDRREPARGSWDVAQWAGSGKTQIARQDRASCGLGEIPPRTRHTNSKTGRIGDSLCNRVSIRQIEFLQERGKSRVLVQTLQ